MNRKEMLEVLAYLREIYPNGKPITDLTVTVWQDIFSGYDPETIKRAAKKTAMEYRGYTMPSPADVLAYVSDPDQETDIELWRIAERWIRRGTVMKRNDFESLPEEIKLYFGGVSAFRDLALLEAEYLPNERARFIKAMPGIRQRVREREALPESLRLFLESENEKEI